MTTMETEAQLSFKDVKWAPFVFKDIKKGHVFFTKAADNWRNRFSLVTIHSRKPEVIVNVKMTMGELYTVSGEVISCDINRSPLVEHAIYLGNTHWLVPTETDVLRGTGVFRFCGTVFNLEKSLNANHANCELLLDSEKQVVTLRFSKDVNVGETAVLLCPANARVVIDDMKFDWLKLMVNVLFELEELAWLEGWTKRNQFGKYLLLEFFSHINSYVGCIRFMKHFGTDGQTADHRYVAGVLQACVGAMENTSMRLTAPIHPEVYPEFPMNHLHFAAIAEQFRFDGTCYTHLRHKVRFYQKYIERHSTMQTMNQFHISARKENEFWDVLGNDGEYFDEVEENMMDEDI